MDKPLVVFCALLVFSYGPAATATEEERTLAEFEPTLPEMFKAQLEATDPSKGEIVFMRKCASCHDHEKKGGDGKGPHLWGIVGRRAGSREGFEYSDAMRGSGHAWTLAALNYYLTNTEKAVPGRIMNFRGIRRDKDRIKLLAFLRSLSDSPKPL